MINGDKLKSNLKNKQLRKITLKFWNNMFVISVFILILVGGISSADIIDDMQDSYVDSNDHVSSDIKITYTDANLAKAYSALSLLEPDAYIKKIDQLSLSSKSDYEVVSDYNVLTKSGPLKVTVTNQINIDTGEIRFFSKKVSYEGVEIFESDKELFVVSDGKLVTLTVSNKANANKFLINSIELLVDISIVEKPFFKGKKEFVVMTDREPDFEYERKLFATDNYQFYVVRCDDLSSLSNSDSIVKISEIKDAFIKKFIEYSKEVLGAETRNEIKRLNLKRTTKDCMELPDLKEYMNEEGWDVKVGQKSLYQQFITPNDSVIKQLSSDMTIKDIYKMAVDWIWVSDKILNNRNEKWLLPNEFIVKTPYFSTNPSKGIPASDCSEQANTLVSLLRAKGVSAEDVRVALGKVDFDGSVGGHAWVEIKEDGRWMVLEPTSGPWYDQDSKSVVDRYGVGYDYWKYHPYPIVEVWCYYNDVYYSEEGENVANGWSNEYEVFTGADLLAGFLLEEPIDTVFIFAIIASIAVISFVLLGSLRRKDME